jgi:hypothetical protein
MKIYSRGGVGVLTDYRENIIVDADHPALVWKANKDRFNPTVFCSEVRKAFPQGLPRIGSEHSEDALSWNVFRSLQPAPDKLGLTADFIAPGADFDAVYFGGRAAHQRSEQIDPEIQDCLNQMEPWGENGVRQQTETDVILRGRDHIIMIESKLGRPGQAVKAWCRSRPGMRAEYAPFLERVEEQRGQALFCRAFDYEKDGNRFYQLFRNYLLGAALSLKWKSEFSLLAVVNSLNCNLDGRSHGEEFGSFRTLLAAPRNVFLITWQRIWEGLCSEPGLRPLQMWLSKHPLLQLQVQ